MSLTLPVQRYLHKHRSLLIVRAGNNLSHSAIARTVGIHRGTVKPWIQQGLPIEAEEPVLTEQDIEKVPPPAPWADWDEVRQVQEALQEHRFLLLRRPENLIPEEKEKVAFLLTARAA